MNRCHRRAPALAKALACITALVLLTVVPRGAAGGVLEPMEPPAPSAFRRATLDDPRWAEPRQADPSLGGTLNGLPPQVAVSLSDYKGRLLVGAGVYLALMLLWLLLGVSRELGPFGLRVTDRAVVRAGRRRYEVRTMTGTVRGQKKDRAASFAVSAYQDAYRQSVSVDTRTDVYDQLRLVDRDGRAADFQLLNRNVLVAEGDKATLGWVVEQGRSTGDYIFFVNHTTGSAWTYRDQLRKMVKPSAALFIPLWQVLGFLPVLPAVQGLSGGAVVLDTQRLLHSGGFGCGLPLLLAIVFFGLRAVVARARVRRLDGQLSANVIARLDPR